MRAIRALSFHIRRKYIFPSEHSIITQITPAPLSSFPSSTYLSTSFQRPYGQIRNLLSSLYHSPKRFSSLHHGRRSFDIDGRDDRRRFPQRKSSGLSPLSDHPAFLSLGLLIRSSRCLELPFPGRAQHHEVAVDWFAGYVLWWRVSYFCPVPIPVLEVG